MKLQYKIIVIPIVVMVSIFIIGMVVVENHLKSTLQERFQQEMHTLSTFALSSVRLLTVKKKLNANDNPFDKLADRIASASTVRVSFFSQQGKLLGDSALTALEVINAKSHHDRAELIDALHQSQGYTKRYSSTLKKEMVYLAKFDPETGFIARVSLPANSYLSTVINLRLNFIIIIVVTIGVIILFGLIAIRLIRNAVQKERILQEARLINRTREITLIQTLSTMLNSAHGIEDAARVLHNIIPKLLASISGALFLVKENHHVMAELTHWGKDWPKDTAIIPGKCFTGDCGDKEQKHRPRVCQVNKYLFAKHALCVSLEDEQGILGALHFISVDQPIDDEVRRIAINLAEQISFAISNLQLKDKLRNQAIRDPLTGLYNRRFMLEAFEPALHRTERHQNKLAVLMIDLDNFKLFNDHFGHEAGDTVLTNVAEQFKNNLRLEDMACRYGGEEFVIICPDTSLRDAYVLAEKLRRCINELKLFHEQQSLGTITMSVGMAIFPNHALTTQELIMQADKALYSAKNRGRNCTVVAQTNNRYYE